MWSSILLQTGHFWVLAFSFYLNLGNSAMQTNPGTTGMLFLKSDFQSLGVMYTSHSGFHQAPKFLWKVSFKVFFSVIHHWKAVDWSGTALLDAVQTRCRAILSLKERIIFLAKTSRVIETEILVRARRNILFNLWVFRWHQEVSTVFHLIQKMALLTLQTRCIPAATLPQLWRPCAGTSSKLSPAQLLMPHLPAHPGTAAVIKGKREASQRLTWLHWSPVSNILEEFCVFERQIEGRCRGEGKRGWEAVIRQGADEGAGVGSRICCSSGKGKEKGAREEQRDSRPKKKEQG